ncbi:hypothetical protein T09_10667 [Trichinella sp. T9]|nr:hypothetical protein T09_10667 [Trichinella sp. T9]
MNYSSPEVEVLICNKMRIKLPQCILHRVHLRKHYAQKEHHVQPRINMEEGGIGYFLKVLSFTLFDHFIKQHYQRWARMNLFEHGFIGIKWLVINPLNSGSAIISNRSYMQGIWCFDISVRIFKLPQSFRRWLPASRYDAPFARPNSQFNDTNCRCLATER